MKTMKKILACMLLVAMLVSMFSMGAMAAATGTVSIEGGTVINDTYSFYKIFELDADASDLTEGSMKLIYKLSAKWSGFTAPDYFTITDGRIVWKGSAANAAAFAALAAQYAANSIDPDSTGHKVTASGATLSVSLAPGYYLMTAVSASGVARTPGIVEVTPGGTTKVSAKDSNIIGLPTIEKTVSEGTSAWAESCDAAMGETVNFKIEITTEAAGQNYVLTDTLSDGFILNAGSFKLVSKGADLKAEDYTLVVDNTNPNKFTITFAQAFLNTLADEDTITVTYSAVLDTDAVVGSTGNTNNVVLSYKGEDGETASKTDSTTTYTYSIGLNKVDGTNTTIQGAEFKLSDGTKDLYVVPVKTDDANNVTVYRLATAADTNATNVITAGHITIIGLDAGTYTFTETKAPAGYIKSTETKSVTVSATTMFAETTVVNTSGIDLPDTGGIGTTIFYVLGAVLLVGAAVILVTRRRMAVEK